MRVAILLSLRRRQGAVLGITLPRTPTIPLQPVRLSPTITSRLPLQLGLLRLQDPPSFWFLTEATRAMFSASTITTSKSGPPLLQRSIPITRSEERRVGKSVDTGGRRNIKKKKR